MRSRVTRLTGVAAGAALVVASLVTAGPANAADEPTGTVNLTIVDDQGKPVNAVVALVPEVIGEGSEPITLTEPVPGKSSYSEAVPVGKYGVMAMGGWSFMTCAGLTSCALMTEDAVSIAGNGAFTVTEGGVVNYTITTPTPKLSGDSKVGSPLAVDVPAVQGLDALLGGMGGLAGYLGLFGASTEASVTWKRDGVAIRGEKDPTYVTTGEDVGRSITAEVRPPSLLNLIVASMDGDGPYGPLDLLPRPVTLGPIVVAKKDSTTDVRIVGKRRVGHTPTAWITVKGADRVNGWITVTGTGDKPLKLRLRDGFAKVELNKLRAGKKTVTATFDGTSTLNASSDTATFKMKKAKDGKKNKNKKSSKKR